MAEKRELAGELYLLGELDFTTGERTHLVKIGVVKENDEKNRSTEKRIKEHQTGNPRQIVELEVLETPRVVRVETLMHQTYAPWRVGGEWFDLSGDRYNEVLRTARSVIADVTAGMATFEKAGELDKIASTGSELVATPESNDLVHQIAVATLAEGVMKAVEDRAIEALASAHDRGVNVGRYITFQMKKRSASFDTARFKKDHPDLYGAFESKSPSWSHSFIPVKPVKLGLDDSVVDPALLQLRDDIFNLADQVEAGATADEMHRKCLEILAYRARYDLDGTAAEDALKALCGTAPGIEGVCTWKRYESERSSFDAEAFKEQHPDLWQDYQKPETTKPANVLTRDLGYRL